MQTFAVPLFLLLEGFRTLGSPTGPLGHQESSHTPWLSVPSAPPFARCTSPSEDLRTGPSQDRQLKASRQHLTIVSVKSCLFVNRLSLFASPEILLRLNPWVFPDRIHIIPSPRHFVKSNSPRGYNSNRRGTSFCLPWLGCEVQGGPRPVEALKWPRRGRLCLPCPVRARTGRHWCTRRRLQAGYLSILN